VALFGTVLSILLFSWLYCSTGKAEQKQAAPQRDSRLSPVIRRRTFAMLMRS